MIMMITDRITLDNLLKLFDVLGYLFLTETIVLEAATEVLIVCGHVDESVTGEVEEDDFLLT